MLNFDIDLTLTNWRCFNVEIQLSFQHCYKDFNFPSIIIYKNKIVFRVNPKSTLFQRWILSMNKRWQIGVDSTWVSGWLTSRRYFNIYLRWINIEYLLGHISFKHRADWCMCVCVSIGVCSFYVSHISSDQVFRQNQLVNYLAVLPRHYGQSER